MTVFEGIAKTNTTNTKSCFNNQEIMFEGIAKTNTTNTFLRFLIVGFLFEGIAKTNTTNTIGRILLKHISLRVLLKQIQQTLIYFFLFLLDV